MEYIDFKLDTIEFLKINPLIDIIKLQPLEKLLIKTHSIGEITQRILNALEFRSKTLKMLKIENFNFQRIDLLFIAKLEYNQSSKKILSKHCPFTYHNRSISGFNILTYM
ncbi:hypothetical protein C1645_841068 [Glomus cerebriforme]|uniref:Uncharacterized protein n=1 Tax=Glomus cerebriforme TaxID=658196 RepID=A0A397S3A1_9GLOM|nr:hypothetical protein C1645_841068 [Glomus cerebriforme]